MTLQALDEIRKKVIYQNSLDIWIATCIEKGWVWNDQSQYKNFINYLMQNDLKMKKFPLCVKESEDDSDDGKTKVEFAEILSETDDPHCAAYTIKLNDDAVRLIRSFNMN